MQLPQAPALAALGDAAEKAVAALEHKVPALAASAVEGAVTSATTQQDPAAASARSAASDDSSAAGGDASAGGPSRRRSVVGPAAGAAAAAPGSDAPAAAGSGATTEDAPAGGARDMEEVITGAWAEAGPAWLDAACVGMLPAQGAARAVG
jgi:hypothetical protein